MSQEIIQEAISVLQESIHDLKQYASTVSSDWKTPADRAKWLDSAINKANSALTNLLTIPIEDADQKFSFAIGSPWRGLPTAIKVYAFHKEVHHGPMEEAVAFKKFIEERAGEEKFIYRLVKMDDDLP